MQQVAEEGRVTGSAAARAQALFAAARERIFRRTDHMFAGLMILQWLVEVVAVFWVSPRVWEGDESRLHPHVWTALLVGGVLTAVPVAMAWWRPGRKLTRHVIAIGQLLTSALLIHFTDGRVETHFHIFGSLAFLAFYRDWPVLVSATLVAILSHAPPGVYWPHSLYGVDRVEPWRWAEHSAWFLFMDVFLFYAIFQSLREMREIAERQASLELLNAGIESQVAERTRELSAARADLEDKIDALAQTERKARQSEESLRRILEYAPDAITVNRLPDFRHLFVNREYAAQFDGAAAIGRTPAELELLVDQGSFKQLQATLEAGGEIRAMELDLRRRDGTIANYLCSFVVIEIGGEQCLVTFGRDITSFKEIERKLRESEAVMRKIFDEHVDPMTIIDAATHTFVDVNQAYLRFYGLTDKQSVIGAAVERFTPKPIAEQLEQSLRVESRIINREVAFTDHLGRPVATLLSVSEMELGGRRRYVTAARDVSRIRRVERKLQESEATLRRIIQSSPDCITIVRLADSTFLEVNEAAAQTMGYTREELTGRRESELRIWNDRRVVKEFLRRVRADGVVKNMEIDLRRKDGSVVPHLTSAVQLEIGGEPCVVSITRDIIDIKRVENELIRAREEALAASTAKSEFLSSMSHEIRTPMNAVLGMADLLAESKLDPEQRRYLDVMVANGSSLLELINSILDLAKIEAGRLQIEATDFNLCEVVEAAAATLAPRAHAKNIELTARLAPDVPEMLLGDPLRLRQLFINLIGNAVKFTNAGEIKIEAEATTLAADSCELLFKVEDTGIGIPEDKLEAIFGSFTQVDSSTTRQYGGSGLGLTIVKRIVELMHGRIWVESKVGHGAAFFMKLPFGLAASAARITPYALPDLRGQRVLVVDDIATNRTIVREMMTARGALVDEASGGAEALFAVRAASRAAQAYDIILLDMRMPGLDGLQTARLIRAEQMAVEPCVLMLSSDDLKPQLARMQECGLDRYLVKPVTRGELFKAIAGLIGPAKQHCGQIERKAEAGGECSTVRLTDERPHGAILVADDSPDNRLLIAAYLKREPWQIDFAEDGRIAVEKFLAKRYDLVLMDLHMPVMDGYESVQAIRQIESEQGLARTPILALTASAFAEVGRAARDAGCDEHVTKPIKKVALLQVIRKYLDRPMSSETTSSEAAPISLA